MNKIEDVLLDAEIMFFKNGFKDTSFKKISDQFFTSFVSFDVGGFTVILEMKNYISSETPSKSIITNLSIVGKSLGNNDWNVLPTVIELMIKTIKLSTSTIDNKLAVGNLIWQIKNLQSSCNKKETKFSY